MYTTCCYKPLSRISRIGRLFSDVEHKVIYAWLDTKYHECGVFCSFVLRYILVRWVPPVCQQCSSSPRVCWGCNPCSDLFICIMHFSLFQWFATTIDEVRLRSDCKVAQSFETLKNSSIDPSIIFCIILNLYPFKFG